MTEYRFLPAAEEELLEQALRYRERAPGLDKEFLNEFEYSIQFVCENPLSTPIYNHKFRSKPFPRFPFNIIYSVEPNFILVVAVAHQRRRPHYWRSRISL